MVVLRTLVFALSLAMFYSLPSDLVCMYTSSVEVPKACLRRREKKATIQYEGNMSEPFNIKNGVKQGCVLAPTLYGIYMSLWKDLIILCRFRGHPIFRRMLKSPSRLTRSNALVRSMKAMKRGFCCSLHFSWSWQKEKIMSSVALGFVHVQPDAVGAGHDTCIHFAHNAQEKDASVVVTVAPVPIVLIQGDDFGIFHVLRDTAFTPALAKGVV